MTSGEASDPHTIQGMESKCKSKMQKSLFALICLPILLSLKIMREYVHAIMHSHTLYTLKHSMRNRSGSKPSV